MLVRPSPVGSSPAAEPSEVWPVAWPKYFSRHQSGIPSVPLLSVSVQLVWEADSHGQLRRAADLHLLGLRLVAHVHGVQRGLVTAVAFRLALKLPDVPPYFTNERTLRDG